MSRGIRQWCRSCLVCYARRSAPTRAHHVFQQDPVIEPLQLVVVDILGPLEPTTDRGNKYVLVIVDYLTKWSEAYPLLNQTTEAIAQRIVDEFICRFGIPEQIHSDQSRHFESELFA